MQPLPADLPSIAQAPAADLPVDLPSFGSAIAVSFVSLGLVCLAAFVVLRWMAGRTPGRNLGPLRVLARQNLDPKRSVFVIEAAQRCFLVGAGEDAMTLIAELDKEAVMQDLALKKASSPLAMTMTGGRFAEVLGRVLGKRPGPTPAAEPRREEV